MVSTRAVLALLTMLLLTGGSVWTYRDREIAGAWLFAAGFAVATGWGLLTLALVARDAAAVRQSTTVALTSVAMVMFILSVRRATELDELP